MILNALLPYLISLAAGLRSDALGKKREEQYQRELKKAREAQGCAEDRLTLQEKLNLIGTRAAEIKNRLGVTPEEAPLFGLLTDELFQRDLARWLRAWDPEEKEAARGDLQRQMVAVMERAKRDPEQVRRFQEEYFDLVERTLFKDPVLSNWRLSLALNAALERMQQLDHELRKQGRNIEKAVLEQHEWTRHRVEEMVRTITAEDAERFSEAQLNGAERRYRELALESCDIIDLANLPESDRHVAARNLELRRLYVPLRIKVEAPAEAPPDEETLEQLEKRRGSAFGGVVEGIPGTGQEEDENDEKVKDNRFPVGERLAAVNRLVLLGDPGAGKTTLVRWLATAYLLRLKQDPAYKDLPDVATLPDRDWLPVVVRCRDLDESCRTGSIDDILCETFRKTHMSANEAEALPAVIRRLLAEGRALLLVDGLDEIADPRVRAGFCQQVERLHIAFPEAPMVVTSRIVGYREMRYRIGRGFEHAVAVDFSKEDKDDFARRWCKLTELPERWESAAKELIRSIHSSDRIERLAGNPMLLTTLALVKRKVGKLPNRRADLYWEAVQVLLNWRSEVDEPMDHREAVPQLQYVAYEMCRRGVQRLVGEELLELLEQMRVEYPKVRPVKNHTPEEFLRLLERRTGLITEAGEVRHNGRMMPVFEFRHLTFQEYLAALALVDGRFPGRDSAKTLANHIAPLAGETEESDSGTVVKSNWREVLRLCVSCCPDDDVDEVLEAVLTPLPEEDPKETARPRAALAVLCLADEPNVGDEAANQVLQVFAGLVREHDGSGNIATALDRAAVELAGSEWGEVLRGRLIDEFCRREPEVRARPGDLAGMMVEALSSEIDLTKCFEKQAELLKCSDNNLVIGAALTIIQMAFKKNATTTPKMIGRLLALLEKDAPSSHAGAWALFWLAENNYWKPNKKETEFLVSFIAQLNFDLEALNYVIWIIKKTKTSLAIDHLISRLSDTRSRVCQEAIEALAALGDLRAFEPLLSKLEDKNQEIRSTALGALARIREDETDRKLLSRYFFDRSWLDPHQPIDEKWVERAAEKLKLPIEDIRRRYEKLAERYNLVLEWKDGREKEAEGTN